MPVKPLQVLEWNVGKQRAAQHSLLNDKRTNDFDLLLLAEPYRFIPEGQTNPVAPQHHYWEAVIPSHFNKTVYGKNNFRSMIYINKRLSFRQIPVESADLTAVTIRRGQTTVLVVSVYAAYHRMKAQRKRELQHQLQAITAIWQQLQQKTANPQLLVSGDFNRHDMLWGGADISMDRLGEGEPILNFMIQHQLYSALPRGTITFCNKAGTRQSTIDLMLVPMQLQHTIQSCQLHNVDHGSDHSAISLTIQLEDGIYVHQQRFRSYNMANWEEIRQALSAKIQLLTSNGHHQGLRCGS